MIAVEDLLNIIHTEALDNSVPTKPERDSEEASALRYDLELVEESDGTLKWYE